MSARPEPARTGAVAAGLLAAALLAGCGYAFGSGLAERGIRTVHLQAVGNDTSRQRFEAELGAAVSQELAVSSDLLPATATTADAILELTIRDERERTLVTGDRPAPVLEGAQAVLVHMRLVERRTGRVVIDRAITDRAEFRDPIGEDLTSVRRELVADLARKIILALEDGF